MFLVDSEGKGVILGKKSLIVNLLKKHIQNVGFEVHVGWFPSAKYRAEDDLPVAEVAVVQEWGCGAADSDSVFSAPYCEDRPYIPPRPFMRPLVKEKANQWGHYALKLSKSAIDGSLDAIGIEDAMGSLISRQLKEQIKKVNLPPLAPVTRAARAYKARYGVPNKKVPIPKIRDAIALGLTGRGQLGDQTFPNKKPLDDTGYMIASATWRNSKGQEGGDGD